MRDHDTIPYLNMPHSVTDAKTFPASLVPYTVRKLRVDRVEPAGYEQVAIVDRSVLDAITI
jgi:hypothetical protein